MQAGFGEAERRSEESGAERQCCHNLQGESQDHQRHLESHHMETDHLSSMAGWQCVQPETASGGRPHIHEPPSGIIDLHSNQCD